MKRAATIFTVVILCLTPILGFGYYLFCLNYVGPDKIGVTYNMKTGVTEVQKDKGFIVTPFYIRATTFPLNPIEVSIMSKAKVINSKLVRFRPEGIEEFTKLHGFEYGLEHHFKDILLGYAYSGREWTFLEVIDESGGARKK
jgi:hypothetical protein